MLIIDHLRPLDDLLAKGYKIEINETEIIVLATLTRYMFIVGGMTTGWVKGRTQICNH